MLYLFSLSLSFSVYLFNFILNKFVHLKRLLYIFIMMKNKLLFNNIE